MVVVRTVHFFPATSLTTLVGTMLRATYGRDTLSALNQSAQVTHSEELSRSDVLLSDFDSTLVIASVSSVLVIVSIALLVFFLCRRLKRTREPSVEH